MFQKVKAETIWGDCILSFEIKHTSSDIHSLIKLIHSIEGESGCNGTLLLHEALLAHQLSEQISLSVLLIPSWSKIFNNDSLQNQVRQS